MDGQRFDGLVRKLATGVSRRSAVKAAAGGAVAAALGLGVAGSSVSAADRKKIGQKCDSKKDCPPGASCKQTFADGGKRCCRKNGNSCDGDRDCCANNFCSGGTCVGGGG